MLACDVLHADRTIYGSGLDLSDLSADIPVGPSCRLCTRRDCSSRQEEALSPGGNRVEVRAPLLPTEFGLGDPS
jgi:predicted transcriptional regulator